MCLSLENLVHNRVESLYRCFISVGTCNLGSTSPRALEVLWLALLHSMLVNGYLHGIPYVRNKPYPLLEIDYVHHIHSNLSMLIPTYLPPAPAQKDLGTWRPRLGTCLVLRSVCKIIDIEPQKDLMDNVVPNIEFVYILDDTGYLMSGYT